MIKHPSIPQKEFSCYTCIECETGGGQTVTVYCNTEKEEQDIIRKAFALIKTVKEPVSHKVTLSHGGFGQYTRYDIIQHDYAGSPVGYIEALEIKDPPDNRCGFVLYIFNNSETGFIEYDSLENCRKGWQNFWGGKSEYKTHKGFIRYVPCEGLEPWFYAVGDEHLMGDHVFPSVFGEHPIYKPQRKFVVRDEFGYPTIKICMGAICVLEPSYNYEVRQKNVERTRVFWSDGTVTLYEGFSDTIKPLEGDCLWMDEAIQEFKILLSGKKSRFQISFLDGTKFTGSLNSKKSQQLPGNYDIKLKVIKDGVEHITSGVVRFKPTKMCPTIKDRIYHDCKDIDVQVLEIISCTKKKKAIRGCSL